MTRTEPSPDHVLGYAEARAQGLLPVVGPSPPDALPGPSAGRRLSAWWAGTAVAFFGTIGVGLLLGDRLSEQGWGPAVLGIAAFGVLAGIWIALGRVGVAVLAELQAGYTTAVMDEGSFWMLNHHPWTNRTFRVLWDYSGTWVLDQRTHAVRAAPDPAVLPPGLYPSPTQAGRWELWTGRMWSGNFRRPPLPPAG